MAVVIGLLFIACKKDPIVVEQACIGNDTIPHYNHWSDTCPPNVHALACSLAYRLGKWVEILDSGTALHRSPDTIEFISASKYNYIYRDSTHINYNTTRELEYYFQWSIWHLENFNNKTNPDGSLIWAQTNTYFDIDKEHFYYRTVTNPVRTYRYKKLE